MYEPGTILELETPYEQDDARSVYNRVRVIGQSPISHATTSDWGGTGAQGVLITPEAAPAEEGKKPISVFGSNLDEPYGKLQKLYGVISIPSPDMEVVAAPVRVINHNSGQVGQTPEEVFAKEAPGKPRPPGPPAYASPLGDVSPTDDNPGLGE